MSANDVTVLSTIILNFSANYIRKFPSHLIDKLKWGRRFWRLIGSDGEITCEKLNFVKKTGLAILSKKV